MDRLRPAGLALRLYLTDHNGPSGSRPALMSPVAIRITLPSPGSNRGIVTMFQTMAPVFGTQDNLILSQYQGPGLNLGNLTFSQYQGHAPTQRDVTSSQFKRPGLTPGNLSASQCHRAANPASGDLTFSRFLVLPRSAPEILTFSLCFRTHHLTRENLTISQCFGHLTDPNRVTARCRSIEMPASHRHLPMSFATRLFVQPWNLQRCTLHPCTLHPPAGGRE
jgi:hypothetical protein